MLREEDIRVEHGLTVGGSYTRMVHVPTGIERWHDGPLPWKLQQSWLSELEAELRARGLLQHIVPAHPLKSRSQKRS